MKPIKLEIKQLHELKNGDLFLFIGNSDLFIAGGTNDHSHEHDYKKERSVTALMDGGNMFTNKFVSVYVVPKERIFKENYKDDIRMLRYAQAAYGNIRRIQE